MAEEPGDVMNDIEALLSKLKHLPGGARVNALSKLQEFLVEIESTSGEQGSPSAEVPVRDGNVQPLRKLQRKRGGLRSHGDANNHVQVLSKTEERKLVVSVDKTKSSQNTSPLKCEESTDQCDNEKISKRRLPSLPLWFNNFSDVPQFLTSKQRTTRKTAAETSPRKRVFSCQDDLDESPVPKEDFIASDNVNEEEKEPEALDMNDDSETVLEKPIVISPNKIVKRRGRRRKGVVGSGDDNNNNNEINTEKETESKTCQVCNRTYINASYLRIHMRQHTGEKPYSCEICERKFSQKSSLWVHKKRHEGKFDHKCNQCDYKSVLKIDLMRHMPKHTGSRVYICDQCGKMFTTDMRLKDHIRHVHVRNERHVCEKCGFSTHRADNLRRHMAVKHSDDELFKCPVCGDMLKQRWTFIVHLRRHTGERPHECTECGKGFKSLSQLAVHRRTHREGEHTCMDCGRKFKTKHHLIRHSVIHSGLKPYSCSYCAYTCNVKGNINKHMKAVHKLANFSFRNVAKAQDGTTGSARVTDKTEQSAIARGQQVTQEFLERISLRKDEQLTVEALQKALPKPVSNGDCEPTIVMPCRGRYRGRETWVAQRRVEMTKTVVEECCTVDDGGFLAKDVDVSNDDLLSAAASSAMSLPQNCVISTSGLEGAQLTAANADEANDLLLLSVKQCLGEQMAGANLDGGDSENTMVAMPEMHVTTTAGGPDEEHQEVVNGTPLIYVIRVVP